MKLDPGDDIRNLLSDVLKEMTKYSHGNHDAVLRCVAICLAYDMMDKGVDFTPVVQARRGHQDPTIGPESGAWALPGGGWAGLNKAHDGFRGGGLPKPAVGPCIKAS